MKFSEQWLREWVAPALTTQELCDKLTMSGLEVDSVAPVAPAFSGIVVGEVLSVAPHPNADKLRVCQVNAGSETLNIVCGAPNVQPGMRAPLARLGAQLPGLVIKPAKLRGVDSQGMLCSAKELGMSEESNGLLPLPGDAPVGADVRGYLKLDDSCIEVDFTPNRGDCLSVQGLAREIGALTGTAVRAPSIAPVAPQIQDTFPVRIAHPRACPRYVGRVVKNVAAAAPTPLWMQEKLRRSGLRSISIVVDITNYVLLELGQPMHAFDLAKLSGGIEVRNAREGESLALLDGKMLNLDSNTLVIADQKEPLALAGIMGGQGSGVTTETRDIFLESAFFSPLPLAGCARRYGLQTDSSYRFERGVDFRLQRQAIERATALLVELAGGQPGPVVEIEDSEHLPRLPLIQLRASRIRRILGCEVPADRVGDALARLGARVGVDGDNWQVTPPSFRFDIRQEIDLIEEIARLHGYENIPAEAPPAHLQMTPALSREQFGARGLQAALVARGYQEAITYSFVSPELQAKLDPGAAVMALANPLASDMAVMRTTLWSGLLPALIYNQKRQQARARLFETGLRFCQENGQLRQTQAIAGVISGSALPEQWGALPREADFFDLKSDVESLLAQAGGDYRFVPAQHPALHPGQCAEVLNAAGARVGLLGALHPALAQALDTSGYLFEFDLAPLLARPVPVYQAISRFPAVRRDLALLLDQDLPAQAVLDLIRQEAGELLAQLQLFDIYQGKGIDPGKKSVAVGLTFRAISRNLTESEVDTVIARILEGLKRTLRASLRD